MRKIFRLALLSFVLAAPSYAQQRVFDWTRANDESVQLDPADYHTGRVYHPAPEGGNIHVDIEARQPLTIAMVWSDEWNNALQHPELMRQLEFRCLREHDPKPPDSADDGTIGRSLIVNHQNHRPVRRKMAFISSADHEKRGPRAHIG